jgi:pimeloyl-ACP methyl ester carboxylesterase
VPRLKARPIHWVGSSPPGTAIPSLPSDRRASLIEDVRGGVRLVADAVVGVSHIAEQLHQRIASLAPPLGVRPERSTRGITGLVYRAVRGGTSLTAQGCERALAALQPLVGDDMGQTPRRDALVSAINGIVGGHLARTGNPLALPMQLVPSTPLKPRVLLMVHGLCMNDQQWTRHGHDHGRALAADLDCAAVYLRYNSGRHVSDNGRELAQQLESLLAQPGTLESLDILAHSMGGLVARSAVRHAQDAGMAWPTRLRSMVFLGTPHHGAVLERGGNGLHRLLGVSPYLAPFTRLSGLRSEGITDLRHGTVINVGAPGRRFDSDDARTHVPLPVGVACFAVAGALGRSRIVDGAIGDGLVTVASALGQHADPAKRLRFARTHRCTARGVGHLDLLSDPAVYARLRDWLRRD